MSDMSGSVPISLVESIDEARKSGDWSRLIEAIPYFGFLGVQFEEADDGIRCLLPPSDKLIGNPMIPALHGGVVGAFLETAAIVQLIAAHETAHVPKIVDISVDYLRSAKPKVTFAQGIITKPGRRVANVRVEAWQDDRSRPVATAHAHFLLA